MLSYLCTCTVLRVLGTVKVRYVFLVGWDLNRSNAATKYINILKTWSCPPTVPPFINHGSLREKRHFLKGLRSEGAARGTPTKGYSLVLNSFFRCVRPVCHCLCPPFSAGHAAFLLFVSQVCHCWWQHFYSFVSQVCHCWCPPSSAGHAAFLFICLPGLSLLVSTLFRWSPRFVTAGVRPFPLAMQHVYSSVSQVCHCWCPPFSAGHAAFLFICLPGLSLLVSALFRWPCSISIHLSPRSVTACVRPFPLAMQHFYSFVSQVISLLLSPRFAACLVSALFRWPCSISIHLSSR